MSENKSAVASRERHAETKSCGRLYVKAIFTGFKRGQRNQHEHTALLTLDGVFNKEDAGFYVGKRAVYVYKGRKGSVFVPSGAASPVFMAILASSDRSFITICRRVLLASESVSCYIRALSEIS